MMNQEHLVVHWTDIAQAIGTSLLGLAAIVTAGVAVYGVRAWRRELKGRAEFDVARAVLLAVYKVRSAVRQARSRLVDASEWLARENRDERQASPDGEDLRYVYTMRWRPIREAASELDVAILEARTLWGEQLDKPLASLNNSLRDLYASTEMYLGMRFDGDEYEPEQKKEIRKVVYGREGDKFDQMLCSSVTGFEDAMRPHLGRRA